MLRFTPWLSDKWVAPSVTEFTAAEIPDLSSRFPEAKHWLTNHFLNNVTSELGGPKFRADYRQVVIGYLRRTFHAFRAYHKARKLAYRYLRRNDPQQPNVRRFYDVMAEWENFTIQSQMACNLLNWLNDVDARNASTVKRVAGKKKRSTDVFQPNDGTKEQRLYLIANNVKHTAGQTSALDTVPLWLTNEGINSFGVSVTFQEASEFLTDMSAIADELQAWPRSLRRTAENTTEG